MYKHKETGIYYRFVYNRSGDVNIYLEVDKENNPIVKKREWSYRPQEQLAIITGFDNLTEIKLK